MRVVLDLGEMVMAQNLASLRRCINQRSGIADQRRDNKQQAIALDMLGTISEIAFCKAFNAYPDLTVSPRKGGADVIVKNRKGEPTRWDVKATDRPDGRLLATVSKTAADVDYFALAVVAEATVDFIGYATAAELLNPATVTDLGHGPTHAIDQKDLHRFVQDQPTADKDNHQ